MQHDSGYHLLFSHPALVEDLFRSFVTEPWVEQLDFTTLERVNAKLHTEWLERRDSAHNPLLFNRRKPLS